jgi:hypothetical protein
MNKSCVPCIGQWYTHLDKGESFLVTAYDDRTRCVEVQSFDGDVDEFDQDTWEQLPLTLAEPPEDWTGPVDHIDVEDLGYSETAMTASDWEAPLHSLPVGGERWESSIAEDENALTVQSSPSEDLSVDSVIARDRADT